MGKSKFLPIFTNSFDIVEISRGEPRNVSLTDVEVSELALKFFQRLDAARSRSAYGL